MSGSYSIVHKAKVLSVDGMELTVLVDAGVSARSCGGCALVAACGRDNRSGKREEVVLHVRVRHGKVPDVGSDVSIGLPKGQSFRATLVVMAFPLTVFFIIAVVCTISGVSEGWTALAALVAAAACHALIFIFNKRDSTSWVLIDEKV